MDLEGKVAIVTGGSSGIGKAIVERYAWEGAEVVIADVDEEAGKEVAEETDSHFIKCDVSDFESVESLVEETVEKYGKLDIMVNNAGIGSVEGIEDMDVEDYEQIRSIDLDGVVYGCKAAAPHLRETEGTIINMASIYGLVGDVGSTAYNASKGGVVNLTRSVASDLADGNVRVNSICPGFVDTPMTEGVQDDEEFMQHIKNQTPLERLAEPEEIASVAAFLASEEASYITGANIPVDGGWTSH
jgi:meso-butanediol dehydrogenase/(S,S)-butanediol dehydrogenase/diacetyl reductase